MKEIKGIARVAFRPGKRDEWKRLTEQAMEIVRTKDTGTLRYDIPVLAMHPGMAAR
jgi:quinol monooxygenase YgiN